MVNTSMWIKALRVIPRISKTEWDHLDVISKWLISTRAAVFVMTAIAGAIGGLLAYRTGNFSWGVFVLAILGIVMAHATNNLLNDLVDYNKGIDKNNYYRSQYGPQPLEHGFMSKSKFLRYILITGLIATLIGVFLTYQTGLETLIFFGLGMFFLLFYTWPLKYIGLGEPSVILVWGPLMVGGTYFVVSGGHWDSWVVVLSLVYALGPTTVLLGKHTDKLLEDKAKGVRTLPVILGEKPSRYITISFWLLQYVFVIWLVLNGTLGFPMLLVLLAVPKLIKAIEVFTKPRPKEAPKDLAPGVWPLYLVRNAFEYNRRFGMLFLLALIIEVIFFRLNILQIL